MVVQNRLYQAKITEAITKHDLLTRAQVMHRLGAFWYSVAISMRFTRGLSGQPRVAVLIQVVYSTLDYLAHFLVVGFVCFFNFAIAGYILFGEHLENWSGIGHCICSLLLVVFGIFDYEALHNVAPYLASLWFWAVFVFLSLLLMNILTAAVLHNYKAVKKRLGEPGASIAQQTQEMLANITFGNTYEGTQKSIPYDVLLHSLVEDKDYKDLEKEGRLMVDRRLRTRDDLAKEEQDPLVDIEYLLDRGCDVSTAEHLLAAVTRWATMITMTTEPEHRMAVKVARQMRSCKGDTTNLRERLRPRVNEASAIVDRSDLKQAKCLSMAKRIKRAQEVPAGWEVHFMDNGRRYLRHKETGLTAWTLPRRMIQ
jgi:hypothetical protein